MDRLTSYEGNYKREMICRYEDCDTCEEYCPDLNADNCPCLQEILEKLAEYEDLEEQGKLLKLPCAVGDTVYCIYNRYTKCSAHNQEFEESSCLGCELECDSRKEYYVQEQKAYSLDWIVTQIVNKHFGKLVFPTREEAEAELKEMEESE